MELKLKQILPYMPYGLRVHYSGLTDDDVSGEFTVIAYHVGNGVSLIDDDALEEGDLSESFYIDYDFPIKPILRPIHTITEEEALELLELCAAVKCYDVRINKCSPDISISGSTGKYKFVVFLNHNKTHAKIHRKGCVRDVSLAYDVYEWLFKNHFDVFGLIDKGLAIEKG